MSAALIIFLSTSHSLLASRLLRGAGIERELVAVPRHLATDCGMGLRIRRDDLERAGGILSANDIPVEIVDNPYVL